MQILIYDNDYLEHSDKDKPKFQSDFFYTC